MTSNGNVLFQILLAICEFSSPLPLNMIGKQRNSFEEIRFWDVRFTSPWIQLSTLAFSAILSTLWRLLGWKESEEGDICVPSELKGSLREAWAVASVRRGRLQEAEMALYTVWLDSIKSRKKGGRVSGHFNLRKRSFFDPLCRIGRVILTLQQRRSKLPRDEANYGLNANSMAHTNRLVCVKRSYTI